MYLFIYLLIYLFIYVFIYLSIHLFIYFYIYYVCVYIYTYIYIYISYLKIYQAKYHIRLKIQFLFGEKRDIVYCQPCWNTKGYGLWISQEAVGSRCLPSPVLFWYCCSSSLPKLRTITIAIIAASTTTMNCLSL